MAPHILFGFAADGSPVGSLWRITARGAGFYVERQGQSDPFHISLHGPNENFATHRFHVKSLETLERKARRKGHLIAHGLEGGSYAFDGREVAQHAYLAVRIRLQSYLQRPEYRTAASGVRQLPDPGSDGIGRYMAEQLEPGEAADLDLVVSYGEPHSPDRTPEFRRHVPLGTLPNNAGMWLTGTLHIRDENTWPDPLVVPPPPVPGQDGVLGLVGGPGAADPADCFWIKEFLSVPGQLEPWLRQQ